VFCSTLFLLLSLRLTLRSKTLHLLWKSFAFPSGSVCSAYSSPTHTGRPSSHNSILGGTDFRSDQVQLTAWLACALFLSSPGCTLSSCHKVREVEQFPFGFLRCEINCRSEVVSHDQFSGCLLLVSRNDILMYVKHIQLGWRGGVSGLEVYHQDVHHV